jgi:hypothetical protein
LKRAVPSEARIAALFPEGAEVAVGMTMKAAAEIAAAVSTAAAGMSVRFIFGRYLRQNQHAPTIVDVHGW